MAHIIKYQGSKMRMVLRKAKKNQSKILTQKNKATQTKKDSHD